MVWWWWGGVGWRCSTTPHPAPLALVSLIRFVRITASHQVKPSVHLRPIPPPPPTPHHLLFPPPPHPRQRKHQTHTHFEHKEGEDTTDAHGKAKEKHSKNRGPPLSPASAPSRRLFSSFFTSSPPPPRHASYPSRVPPRAPRPSRAVRPSSPPPTSPALQAASATQTSTLEVLCAQPASYCIARVACPSHRDGLPPHPAVRHLFLFTQSHAPLCPLPPTTTTLVCSCGGGGESVSKVRRW